MQVPKFIKKLSEKIKAYPRTVLSTAVAMTNMTIEQTFQLCFLAINGYIMGKPDNKAKLVWHTVIERAVDNESICDDSGFEGMKIKKRVKLIGKEKLLSSQSIAWIKNELKPYFADSLKKQKQNLSDIMFEHIVNGSPDSEDTKHFYDIYQKKQGFFNRVKK